jgi:hypothetical protein
MTMTRLPTPEQWVIKKLNEMETAELIERYNDYFAVDKNGNERSVHLPTQFVRRYMTRSDGALPTVAAIATMPIVLAYGALLAPPGLDRLRCIQFIIPDEVRAIIPKPEECTPDAVRKAMKLLTDEWLCDVATDFTGKAQVIAMALTLIERSLLDSRPVFFIAAGKRGNGKTTLIIMLVMAVLGTMPAAAAWSNNEEERRKALLSYLLYGVPYILWDNIKRGTQISCSHIEAACTTTLFSDRVLGVSEIAKTSASSIQFFTGNAIGAKGDLASRSLMVTLDTGRADPENREFKHNDPIGWTERHRVELVRAFYTILLGNPQLKAKHDAPGKTRFKMWWRLVGSAVEHAAKLSGEEVDFGKLFMAREDDDEETTSLAEMLEVMLRIWPQGFTAQQVASRISNLGRDDEAQVIRDALQPGMEQSYVFSTLRVARLLRNFVDAPVFSGNSTLTLVSEMDKHSKTLRYTVIKQVNKVEVA